MKIAPAFRVYAVLSGVACLVLLAAASPPVPAPARAPGVTRGPRPLTLPAEPPRAKDPRLVDLDARIAALRAERKSQLDPLEAQLKAVRERYDAPIDSLQAERRRIQEDDESPALRDLDQREDADLAALAERERKDMDALRQRYDDERKTLRQSYADRRKSAGP